VTSHWRKTPTGGRTWVDGHSRAGGSVSGWESCGCGANISTEGA
jgi:hypothetical protein